MKIYRFCLYAALAVISPDLANGQNGCDRYAPSGLIVKYGGSTLCLGDSSKFLIECPNTRTRVTWTGGEGRIDPDGGFVVRPKQSTLYTATVTAGEGCLWTYTRNVDIRSGQLVTVSEDVTICQGDTATVSISRIDGDASYFIFSFDPYKVSADTAFRVWPKKTTKYRLEGALPFSSSTCFSSDYVTVNVVEPNAIKPVAIFPDGEENKMTVSLDIGDGFKIPGGNYTWNFGDGPETETGRFAQHTFSKPGVYRASLFADFGNNCTQTVPIPLDVLKITVPNIVTPNADGQNDTFRPLISNFPISVKVFNRDGTLLLEESNYHGDWGTKAAAGTYFYQISNREGRSWNGWLEIAR